MKIQVRSNRIQDGEAIRAYVERRLQFRLGRLSTRILRATVQIVDINGPRGGEDKVCRIEIRLRPTGTIFVDETNATLYAAIDGAADRAERAVSRTLMRTRNAEREPAPPHPTAVIPLDSDPDEPTAA